MPIQLGATGITFHDNTVQTTAATAGGSLQTQIFTSPGTFTTPASTTQVRVTVVGGGGGSAGPGRPQPSFSGGTSSFSTLVSASGGSGAPNGPGGPVSPGSGSVSVGTTIISSYAGTNGPNITPSATYISGAFVGGISTNALNSVAYSVSNRDNGAGAAGGPYSNPVAGGGAGGLAVAIVPVTASTSYPISVGSGGPGAVSSRFGGIGGVVIVEFVG